MQTIYKFILTLIRPILIWVGTVSLPFTSKKHIFSKFYEIQDILQPGDIILTISRGHLSNVLNKVVNKGKYNHALMYIGVYNGHPSIIEAVGDGVIIKTVPVLLSDKDALSIVRPLEITLSESEKKKAIDFAINQLGKSYDYLFEIGGGEGSKAYYCSELVFESYRFANPNIKFIREESLGYSTVTPNDFYNAKKYFKVMFEI